MEWHIDSFEGVGAIRFGMTVSDVENLLGAPDRTRKGLLSGSFAEFRGTLAPVVRYRDGEVSEVEGFYDLQGVRYKEIEVFRAEGLVVMQAFETLNGGALESVGMVLFKDIGISAGRLDHPGREYHSVTAFRRGLWDGRTADMKPISFF